MKENLRSIIPAVLTAVLLGMPWGVLNAGQLRFELDLPADQLKLDCQENYVRVSFMDCAYDVVPGYPAVPYMVKDFLMPAGSKVREIHLEVSDIRTVNLEKPLYPIQPARPLSFQDVGFVGPDVDAYASVTPLDDFRAEIRSEGKLYGANILSVVIRPLRYTPAQGKLEFAKRLVLTIEYEQDASGVMPVGLLPSQLENLETSLKSIVVNPEEFESYRYLYVRPMAPAATGYRHAIVTSATLASSFQPLAEWNTKRGVRDTVVTIESINAQYQGRDWAEKIRNFVKYAYQNWGLEYLLLGGDEGIVPTRDCFVGVSGGPNDPSEDTIPTDMYFGCLDGTWDGNNNSTFGELSDNVDLLAEVAVGRASIKDATEAALFVSKVKSYEEAPPSGFASELLLPSEVLWDSPYYPGDATNDAIAAMAPSGTKISKLYETLGKLSRQAVVDSLEAGVGLVHHCAHGNTVAISCADGSLSTIQASALNNGGRLHVYVSIACYVGAFDNSTIDCLVEAFMKAKQGGSVAWVGNSRYGWGTPPFRGPSEDLDVSFFDEVYHQDNPDAGFSLARAKEVNISSWASSDFGRWSIYELNLHGDPAMSVHYREPSPFTISYTQPVAAPQSWKVTVSSQAGYPVEGMLVCASQDPNVYAWTTTDASGVAYLDIEPSQGKMSLTVTGANHRAWTADTITVGKRQPEIYLSPDTVWVDAEIDPLQAYFTIANNGTDTLRVSNIKAYNTSWIKSFSIISTNIPLQEDHGVYFDVDTTGLADGILAGSIAISSNDPTKPTAYEPVKLIKGDWPDIKIIPDSLVFNMPVGDFLSKQASVSNQGRAELVISSVATTTTWIKGITPTGFTLSPGDTSSLSVDVDTAALGFGTFKGKLTFSTNDPDEQTVNYSVVLVMGEPDIALSPDTLRFFFSYDDSSQNVTKCDMVVSNPGTRTLSVTNMVPSRKWLLLEEKAFELEPGGTHNVNVSVHPTGLRQGIYNATITIASNDPDGASTVEPVRFLVEEAPPVIACTPDTVIVDEVSMKGSFWVFNLGMRSLTVEKISTELPWIKWFYPDFFIVSGGDSVKVSIIGDPDPKGPSRGVISIKSNDTHTPVYSQPVKLGSGSGIDEQLPKVFELSEVSPNPVQGQCLVRFALPCESEVSVSLFDVTGRAVRTFVSGTTPAGYHLAVWRGEDDRGRALPQGLYFLRMEAPEYKAVRKLVLLR